MKRIIQVCRSQGLNAIKADLNESLPFKDRSFDVVFCSHTLEHVYSPLLLLKEFNRVLKDSGLVIIAVPTERSLVRILVDHYFKDHPSHIYGFSVDCLQRLLELAGFRPIRLYVDVPLTHKPGLRWLCKLANKVPKIFSGISNAFWIIGKKE